MAYLKIVDGDLLDATEDYLAHQCNCCSTGAKALAELMFDKYPHANSYNKRIKNNKSTYSKPGTIEVFDNVINMYAQYYPAFGKYNNDSVVKRVEWFKACLVDISKIKDIKLKTIAMPFNIGCGAAGGDWNVYYKMIEEFATKEKIHVTLYKL